MQPKYGRPQSWRLSPRVLRAVSSRRLSGRHMACARGLALSTSSSALLVHGQPLASASSGAASQLVLKAAAGRILLSSPRRLSYHDRFRPIWKWKRGRSNGISLPSPPPTFTLQGGSVCDIGQGPSLSSLSQILIPSAWPSTPCVGTLRQCGVKWRVVCSTSRRSTGHFGLG